MSDSVWPHRRQPTRIPGPWDSPGKKTGDSCHFLLQCVKVKSESEVAQSSPTLCDPMDCSPPGSSVHGIFQARAVEGGAIAFFGAHYYPSPSGAVLRWRLSPPLLAAGEWAKAEDRNTLRKSTCTDNLSKQPVQPSKIVHWFFFSSGLPFYKWWRVTISKKWYLTNFPPLPIR